MNTLYNDLDTLLILALTESFHGPKAMYKKAIKLLKCVKPKVEAGLLKFILASGIGTAVKELYTFCDEYLYYALPAAELGKDGFDGMMIMGEEVYPIVVNYESQEDYNWLVKNEEEIYTAACFDIMDRHNVRKCAAEFLMFPKHGYRGIPQWWGVEDEHNELRILDVISEDTTPLGRVSTSKQVNV